MSPDLKSAPSTTTTAPPPQPAKRKLPKPILYGAGALLVVIILVVYLLNRNHESTDDAFIEGHIMQVSPQVAGSITKVLVSDNQEVKAGDLLVQLDPRDNKAIFDQAQANYESSVAKLAQAKAQYASAEASLSEAQSDVEETRATSENATKELKRSQELSKRGVVSQQDLDRSRAVALASQAGLQSKTKRVLGTQSDLNVGIAQVKAAEAQVELASAMLDTAKLRLSYTDIHAPESGRVTRKNVEVGNFVQTGAALMAIVPKEVWVVANFKETQLHHMRPGQPVDVKIDAYPSLHIKGKVDSIQAGTGARFSLLPSENATGNYVKVVQRVPVKISLVDVPPDSPLLAPGMSVSPTVDVAP